jgi:ribosomal protein S18 acetylase RimI-like enzyme
MNIQPAKLSDKEQIQNLMNELNSYRKSLFSQENIEFHQRVNPYPPLSESDLEDTIIFVAEDSSNSIVGFIQGTIHFRKNHKLSKLGSIDELYIQPELRKSGLATELFQLLETELRTRGCDHLTTFTDFENQLSQNFYTKLGMQKATIEFWKKL